jgi:hypothetical protein
MAGDLTVRNIKVTDRIEPGSAGGTVTLGNSINADTIAVPSGVTLNINSGATFSATAGTMSGHNYPSFKATQNVAQTLEDNTFTILNLETENWDTDNAYDNATNYRFTVPSGKAGKYFFVGSMRISGLADQDKTQLRIYKNGNSQNTGSLFYFMPSAENAVMQVSFSDDAAVGDYYDLRGYHFSGETKDTGAGYSSFFGFRIGA